jgi:hypothetical protein
MISHSTEFESLDLARKRPQRYGQRLFLIMTGDLDDQLLHFEAVEIPGYAARSQTATVFPVLARTP